MIIIIVIKIKIMKRERNETQEKPRDAQRNHSTPTDQHRSSDPPLPASSPHLYTEHVVLWYGVSLCLVWVSCPGYAPSHLLVHLRTGKTWEAENSLISEELNPSAYYQHSHTESNTQPYSRYRQGQLALCQPKPGQSHTCGTDTKGYSAKDTPKNDQFVNCCYF